MYVCSIGSDGSTGSSLIFLGSSYYGLRTVSPVLL